MVTESNDAELEAVFETIDAAEAAIVKSLLDSADIPYLTQGEDTYDAFRGTFRGTVFSRDGRPIVFLVPRDLAADVRQLLQEPSE